MSIYPSPTPSSASPTAVTTSVAVSRSAAEPLAPCGGKSPSSAELAASLGPMSPAVAVHEAAHHPTRTGGYFSGRSKMWWTVLILIVLAIIAVIVLVIWLILRGGGCSDDPCKDLCNAYVHSALGTVKPDAVVETSASGYTDLCNYSWCNSEDPANAGVLFGINGNDICFNDKGLYQVDVEANWGVGGTGESANVAVPVVFDNIISACIPDPSGGWGSDTCPSGVELSSMISTGIYDSSATPAFVGTAGSARLSFVTRVCNPCNVVRLRQSWPESVFTTEFEGDVARRPESIRVSVRRLDTKAIKQCKPKCVPDPCCKPVAVDCCA